jgi:hypothetical protein
MFRTLFLTVILAAGLAGCGTFYTNVPPLPGDLAAHDPNDRRVANMEAAALKHILQNNPPGGPYVIGLPPGTNAATAALVLSKLPPTQAGAADAKVYRVAQIQARSFNAQVDVVAPEPNNDTRLISVFLGTDMDGWFVLRSRKWGVPVDEALLMARPLGAKPDQKTAPDLNTVHNSKPDAAPKP